MANALFDPGREGFLDGSIDWDTDTIKWTLRPSGYTFSAAHKFLSEVTALAAAIGTDQTLAGKTVTSGVADGDDLTWTSVASGSTVAKLVGYKSTGTESTSRLVGYIDTVTSGLPVATNGGNITVQWDNGTNRIFKL